MGSASETTYRNPTPTVDVIIELETGIVLIERQNAPHGWALPGGFVDEGESVEQAAMREALEETGLEVSLTALLGVYSDPRRDPRKHTLSVVYIAHASGKLIAGDDAGKVMVLSWQDDPPPLAFDHAQILADYRRYRQQGLKPTPAEQLSRLQAELLHS